MKKIQWRIEMPVKLLVFLNQNFNSLADEKRIKSITWLDGRWHVIYYKVTNVTR